MSSVSEAELRALYINAREEVYFQVTLEEMGHNQTRTLIHTDTSTAFGVITNDMQPKQTKSMHMRFHWLCDREAHKQI